MAVVEANIFDGAQQPCQCPPVTAAGAFQGGIHIVFPGFAAGSEHILDHPLEPETLAVARRVNARHTVIVEGPALFGNNDPAATAENADVAATALAQHIHHVFEVLHMTALIGTHGDTVHILLEGGTDHLLHGAVVAQMDDFGACRLQDAAHDIDGSIVAIEKTGGGNESQTYRSDRRLRGGRQLCDGGLGHVALLGTGNQNPK